MTTDAQADQVVVRPVRADDDYQALTDLLHRSYAALAAQGLNYTAVDQDEQMTRRRAEAGHCLLAVRAGELVGTVTMSIPPSQSLRDLTDAARPERCAWLNQLAVDPTVQGSGVGAALWSAGRAWALAAGACRIGVDTATPARHLVALYQRWSFVQVDTIQWPGKTYTSAVLILKP